MATYRVIVTEDYRFINGKPREDLVAISFKDHLGIGHEIIYDLLA